MTPLTTYHVAKYTYTNYYLLLKDKTLITQNLTLRPYTNWSDRLKQTSQAKMSSFRSLVGFLDRVLSTLTLLVNTCHTSLDSMTTYTKEIDKNYFQPLKLEISSFCRVVQFFFVRVANIFFAWAHPPWADEYEISSHMIKTQLFIQATLFLIHK
jgi:hypothetical protein